MTEWAREERNKVQQVNHVVDMQAMAYIPRLYDIMVKSIDEDRKTNSALSKLENTFRSELRGYSASMKEALGKGGKLNSNDFDDMKAHLEKVSGVLSQLEKEANTRHKKEVYANFNNELAALVNQAMERMYQSMDDVSKRATGLGMTFEKAVKQIESSTSSYVALMKKASGGKTTKSGDPDLTKILPYDLAVKAGLGSALNKKWDYTKRGDLYKPTGEDLLAKIGYDSQWKKKLENNTKVVTGKTALFGNYVRPSDRMFDLFSQNPKDTRSMNDRLFDIANKINKSSDYVFDAVHEFAKKSPIPSDPARDYRIANEKRSFQSGALGDLVRELKAQKGMMSLFPNGKPIVTTSFASGGAMTLPPATAQAAAVHYGAKLPVYNHPTSTSHVLNQIKDPENNFFRDLHTAIGSLPFIGTLTGFASKTERGAKAGGAVGKILKILPGPLGKIGRAMGLIGAIATATGLIIKRLRKSSPVLDAVMSLFELAFNLFFMPFGNFLGQWLLPMAEDIINYAVMLNKFLTDFSLESLFQLFLASFQIAWGWISQAIFRMPIELIKLLSDWFAGFFTLIGLDGVASALGDFNEVLDEVYYWLTKWPTELSHWFSDAIDRFKTWVHDRYKALWDKLPGYITGVGNTIVNGVKTAISSLATFVGELVGKIGNIGGDVLKGAYNSTLGAIGLPKLATGGIVTSPTVAMVGEAGPEAVVPLDKAGGIGTTYVININGDVYGVSDLESRIERVIQRTANKAYYR